MQTRQRRTEWFKNARWGVLTHYLADTASATTEVSITTDEWNRRIDAFDVDTLASQLESIGAPYYFITLGQNSGYYCAPNATYDSIVGRSPSRCSQRDLIVDLYEALHPRGIQLLLYTTNCAPANDALAVQKLQWAWGYDGPAGIYYGPKRTGARLAEFQVQWEAVLRDWSLRWGNKVAGWWVDGCYFNDAMYDFPEPPNFQSFTAAIRAGNPEALVALNPGVHILKCATEYEDYTAGEVDVSFPATDGRRSVQRWIGTDQFHLLSFLGQWWGQGEPRFPDEFVIGYTRYVNNHEGVMTWDIPISHSGHLPQAFLHQLSALHRALA
ncbi:MAG: hypothetical protein M1546_13695 [Chloroflexi bacterium]|nr:hypothetical protein [Chloroflexota bacterium]